jgi:hypothetical protein
MTLLNPRGKQHDSARNAAMAMLKIGSDSNRGATTMLRKNIIMNV